MKKFQKIIALGTLLITATATFAQEVVNETQYRTELGLSYSPFKKIKFSFNPEIRFDDTFSADKYVFEGGIEYKPVKFLELEANSRYLVNPRDTKETEYFNRYAFSVTGKKEFGRFETALRLRYSNDADDDITDEKFLRYKFSTEYNIPKCKITPSVAVEAFQSLGDESGLHKMRYSAGLDYKLFKNNYIGIVYKFDYYQTEYTNRHIISLGYKIKF